MMSKLRGHSSIQGLLNPRTLVAGVRGIEGLVVGLVEADAIVLDQEANYWSAVGLLWQGELLLTRVPLQRDSDPPAFLTPLLDRIDRVGEAVEEWPESVIRGKTCVPHPDEV